jgi:hypothetical protein
LFVLTSGQYLVAQELGRNCGKIKVKDPALVAPAKTGLGFVFTPIMFVQTPTLYEQAIMIEDTLPPVILDSYLTFQKQLARERDNKTG